MPFEIEITAEAESHLLDLPVREQRLIEAAVVTRLVHQATTPSRSVKRLRPNPYADFELRVGDLRVLYNVEGTTVVLLVVGRKVGNKLIVKGVEFHEHQGDSPQPPGAESSGDAG